jgi:single-stranded DNA-binding protein
MNSVALVGIATKDAVKDFKRNGQKVYKFRVAVPYDKRGNAFFVNVDWETDAEIFVKKGSRLFIKGRIFIKNKDGKDIPKIVAESVDFIDLRRRRNRNNKNIKEQNEKKSEETKNQ